MSRDERIKYGKELTKDLVGRSAVVRSDASHVLSNLSSFGSSVRKREIMDDLMKNGEKEFDSKFDDGFKEYKEKFVDEIKPYISKVDNAESDYLKYVRKLNGGKEKMTEKDLKGLEKSIKAHKKAFDDVEEVLNKYGVRSEHYNDVEDEDSDNHYMFV